MGTMGSYFGKENIKMKLSFIFAFSLLLILTGCRGGDRDQLSVTIQGDSQGAMELSDYLAKHPIVVDKSTGISYKLIIVHPDKNINYKIIEVTPDKNIDYKIRVFDPLTGQDIAGLSEQLTSTFRTLNFKEGDFKKK
jgi:hypothetical protein